MLKDVEDTIKEVLVKRFFFVRENHRMARKERSKCDWILELFYPDRTTTSPLVDVPDS